jgi:hypothetical protein
MPRLNYGTLLENIVVLESTRLCLEQLDPGDALGFATSFAMPALTQCWCKQSEETANPWFSHAFLEQLRGSHHEVGSLQSMWALCLDNRPRLPIRRFHQKEGRLLYKRGGPNGALLAALLANHSDRAIKIWANDDAERYPSSESTGPGDATDECDELKAVGLLLEVEPLGSTIHVVGLFPDTIARLDSWLQGEGRSTRTRVGFLDPDNYAEGETQVSSLDHRRWLRSLASGAGHVLSAMFSGCQNRGRGNAKRNNRLASFHGGEMGLFPHSLVFEYGNFQTGVKIRCPTHDLRECLRHRVEMAWRRWSGSLDALTVHVDGQAAN